MKTMKKLTEILEITGKSLKECNPLYDAILWGQTLQMMKTIAEDAKKLKVSLRFRWRCQYRRLFKLASFIRVWGLGIAALLIFIAFLDFKYKFITIISRSHEEFDHAAVELRQLYQWTVLVERPLSSLLNYRTICFGLYCLSLFTSVNKSLVGQIYPWLVQFI